MSIERALLPDPDPLRAVAVSSDLQGFDLLIDDMEIVFGQAWADLDLKDAPAFFQDGEARHLEVAVIATDAGDATRSDDVVELVRTARRAGLRTVLVARSLDKPALEVLFDAGLDTHIPYPFSGNDVTDALARICGGSSKSGPREARHSDNADDIGSDRIGATPMRRSSDRTEPGRSAPAREPRAAGGALFAIQSAAGGDGATTIAVNLAWELANIDKSRAPRVCLIDLGLQFGSVATYLDLPRKPMIYEVLSDVAAMDEQAFRQALVLYKDRLQVFTAPSDILPLDLIGPADVTGLLSLAQTCFDIVLVDMPATVTGWTDAVFKLCDLYFMVCTLEVRSAQNALRFSKLLQAEGLATEKLSFLLNRAPGRMAGRGRIDRMADGLGIRFHAVLPDGGKQVTEVNDQAAPLSTLAPRNALARDLKKVARELQDARVAITGGQTADRDGKSGRRLLGITFG